MSVDGTIVELPCEPGLLVLLGVTHDDGPEQVAWTARKIWGLRILRDERVRVRRGCPDPGRQPVHVVRRRAQGPASHLERGRSRRGGGADYEQFCDELERLGATVSRGVFGADMQVSLVNDGPVTMLLDTAS